MRCDICGTEDEYTYEVLGTGDIREMLCTQCYRLYVFTQRLKGKELDPVKQWKTYPEGKK